MNFQVIALYLFDNQAKIFDELELGDMLIAQNQNPNNNVKQI